MTLPDCGVITATTTLNGKPRLHGFVQGGGHWQPDIHMALFLIECRIVRSLVSGYEAYSPQGLTLDDHGLYVYFEAIVLSLNRDWG